MRTRWVSALVGALLLGPLPAVATPATPVTAPTLTERSERADAPRQVARSFELVGRNSLLNRGVNSALAIRRHWAYVGSRTDGTHSDTGVLVLDIAEPRRPVVVNRIDAPKQARRGHTARELRV